ncbi:MAG TPA: TonB family protein [Gemmatimonadaceae bacterium]|nr:TonB family protein [Gemmatimonadaceae bacterium]
MLNVLLESNTAPTRRTGGTLTSMLVHAAIATSAITLTTGSEVSRPAPPAEIVLPPVVLDRPHQPRVSSDPHVDRRTATASPVVPRIPRVDHVPETIPTVDVEVNVRVATDDEAARGAIGPAIQSPGGKIGAGGPPEGVLEERYVDRGPRILGLAIQPWFPTSLRERGTGGRVTVQFVVDTSGRAEMSGLKIVQASDSLFAQSVRAVLPRYRFSPGEVGGSKVRTLVQLPFDFTLVR